MAAARSTHSSTRPHNTCTPSTTGLGRMRSLGRILFRGSGSSGGGHGLVRSGSRHHRGAAATVGGVGYGRPAPASALLRCCQSTKAAAAAKGGGGAAAAHAEGEGGCGGRVGARAGIRPKGPSFAGRRGESGRGWFQLYEEEGPAGFQRYRPPTPFDWEKDAGKVKRSKAYLDVSLDKEPAGRIVIELAEDILPLTAKNFMLLCQGKDAKGEPLGRGYTGSGFHKIVKRGGIVGGDLASATAPSAEGNHSAFGARFFHDEGFIIPHSAPGLVSMVSAGVHRNGSHFHITTEPCPHLDGRAVAFGRVVEGMEVVKKIASTYSIRGRPVAAVRIEKAGML